MLRVSETLVSSSLVPGLATNLPKTEPNSGIGHQFQGRVKSVQMSSVPGR